MTVQEKWVQCLILSASSRMENLLIMNLRLWIILTNGIMSPKNYMPILLMVSPSEIIVYR